MRPRRVRGHCDRHLFEARQRRHVGVAVSFVCSSTTTSGINTGWRIYVDGIVRPQFRADENAFLSQNAIFNSTLTRSNGLGAEATIDQFSGVRFDESPATKEEALPNYSDQVLPFDVTLAGTNEMGAATCMKIFGVEILNEGSGISIDDAVTEMQATFVTQVPNKRCCCCV